MASTSESAASQRAIGPDGTGPVTIAFLMEDYVAHLRHHLEDMRELVA